MEKQKLKERKSRIQKGITLIALIITIVVLLILAVVTIRAVQGDGIIAHANESKIKTQQSQSDEKQRLLEYEYQIAKQNGTFTGTYDDYVLEKKYKLKIGDYVDYTYDKVNDGYSLSKTYSGYSNNQKIVQPTTKLKWRVLGLDKNENVELISDTPSIATNVYFNGSAGYNNAVYFLNDMCEKLYSNSELGIKARSLRIEDIEEQFSDAGKNERDTYKHSNGAATYGGTKSYKTNNKYPKIYAEEVGFGTNETIREGGIGPSENFYTKENLTTAYATAKDSKGNSTSLITTQTNYKFSSTPSSYFENEIFHEMIFETGKSYWVASRCVSCFYNEAYFCISFVNRADLIAYVLFDSRGAGSTHAPYSYLRPVVSLGSGVSIDTSTGNGTSTSMYKLAQNS